MMYECASGAAVLCSRLRSTVRTRVAWCALLFTHLVTTTAIAWGQEEEPFLQESFYVATPQSEHSEALRVCGRQFSSAVLDSGRYMERNSPDIVETVSQCLSTSEPSFQRACDLAVARSQIDLIVYLSVKRTNEGFLFEASVLSPLQNATLWSELLHNTVDTTGVSAALSSCEMLAQAFLNPLSTTNVVPSSEEAIEERPNSGNPALEALLSRAAPTVVPKEELLVRVTVRSNVGNANIKINGHIQGITLPDHEAVSFEVLPIESAQFEVERKGYREVQGTLHLLPGSQRELVVTLGYAQRSACPIGFVYARSNAPTECTLEQTLGAQELGALCRDGIEVHMTCEKACALQDGESCFAMGMLMDMASSEGRTQAMAHFAQSCLAGHPSGCYGIGTVHHWLGDFDNARLYYREGCDGGEAKACLELEKIGLKIDQRRIERCFNVPQP